MPVGRDGITVTGWCGILAAADSGLQLSSGVRNALKLGDDPLDLRQFVPS
jgi:hypothetical protein